MTKSKARELAGTEGKILEAASHIFATLGYHGAALRDIANLVGVQTASLYHYVDNKQTLLFKVIVGALEHRKEAVLRSLGEATAPTERLAALTRAHVEFQGDWADQARVCHDEIRSLDAENRGAVTALISDYDAVLEAILRDGEREGDFEVDDVATTAHALIDSWDGVSIWYRPGGRWSLAEIGELYAQLAIAAVSVEPPPAGETVAPEVEEPMHATREEILNVATEIFAERGYHGTTVRDIATTTDVQPSVIYHHFGSKEDLLFAILRTSMLTSLDAARTAVAAERGSVGELSALIQANVRVDALRPFAAIVSDAELDALSEPHLAAIRELRREYENLIAGIIERGRAEELFSVPSTRLTVYAIARMCNGVGQWCDPSDSDQVELLGQRYTHLILASLGYSAPGSGSRRRQ